MAVLDKGQRNLEILKQPQYTPMRVEHQVAILYCGTQNLLRRVPVNSVIDFQTALLQDLEENHKNLLDNLAEGKFDKDIENELGTAARAVVSRFEV